MPEVGEQSLDFSPAHQPEGAVEQKKQSEIPAWRSNAKTSVALRRNLSTPESLVRRLSSTEVEDREKITIGAATAAEKVNEDNHFYDQQGIAVVCDGVGSSENGGVASEVATDLLAKQLQKIDTDTNRENAEKSIADALQDTDMFIQWEQAMTGQDMASTASVMKVITEGEKTYAVIGNVGDSPVYRMRNGKLKELTNYNQDLPAREHRQALGKDLPLRPHVFSVRFKQGDLLLLTSNGVRKNDPEMKGMRKILDKIREPQKIAESLVTRLNGKSRDARTVIVVARPPK